MPIDLDSRKEELARDLVANFDKRTLASFIAGELMEPARLQSFGNPALKKARKEGFERVAAFEEKRSAEDEALRAEARSARKKAAAERQLKAAMKEGTT